LLSYALKRIVRSWKLFAALILGMMLAGTFFGGINVGADTVGKQALDQQLASTPVDIRIGESLYGSYNQVPASTLERVASEVDKVDGVVASEPRGHASVSNPNISYATVRAIPNASVLYGHMTVLPGGRLPQAVNETLVNANSEIADNYPVGTTLSFNLSSGFPPAVSLSLKIVGVASLDKTAAQTFGLFYSSFESGGAIYPQTPQSVLVVSWEQTFSLLVNWASQQSGPVYGVVPYVDVNLDRDRLIAPWDIEGSLTKIQQVEAQVTRIAAQNGLSSNPYLLQQLAAFAPSLLALRAAFIVFSIPVFFMAWYVGRTVSQASYNLRRREIGLLMTKGFAKSQLFRHFLVEAIIVGLVSGLLGLALAFVLNPYFVQALGSTYQGTVLLSTGAAVGTVVFTVILTFLSVLTPARQASGMDPAKALREYVYVEDVRASRKTFAWVAFLLGLYKITFLILGINFVTLFSVLSAGGFLFALVFIIMAILDIILTFTGPFLFLYGATQLSTGLAIRFHRLFTRLSKRLVGDIATLASNSVFRNPRRVASLVFLVALIAGYSIWVIGEVASMEDFNIRQTRTRVGADISITNLSTFQNASAIATSLRSWTGNITATTTEQEIQVSLSSFGSVQVRAIDPATWKEAAYYEPEWFTGGLNTILQTLSADSGTIVLDHGVASHYGINQGDSLTIPPVSLRVVGLFGPDYSQSSTPGIIVPLGAFFYPQGWSYMPQSIITQLSGASATNRVLVKAAPGVSLTDLGQSISQAFPWATIQVSETSVETSFGVVFGGMLNVLRLGTVFAAAAACIGVGAVSYTGFKEREKETTMITVRGFSYRQVLGVLVTEALPLVIFALLLATAVGLVTVRGDIMALNSQSFSPDYYSLLAPRRIAFPPSAQTTLLTIYGLLLIGVFVPAIVFARKDLSKISRTVRFA
jgi:ABC-type antimicrobial peptide transport system permease subunit